MKNQLQESGALTVIRAEAPVNIGDFPRNSTSIKGDRAEVQLVVWEHHPGDPLQEAQEEAQGDRVDQELEGRLITLQVVEAHPINHQGVEDHHTCQGEEDRLTILQVVEDHHTCQGEEDHLTILPVVEDHHSTLPVEGAKGHLHTTPHQTENEHQTGRTVSDQPRLQVR